MGKDGIKDELVRLRAEVAYHRNQYYDKAEPEISDVDYDALEDRLRLLEKEYPEFASPESPTLHVGGITDSRFPSEKHSRGMLSLQNSYDFSEVASFVARVQKELKRALADDSAAADNLPANEFASINFTIEPKIDGVALAVRFINGKLAMALTRGDGKKGDVITANAATFREIPNFLPEGWQDVFQGDCPSAFEVRGEAYLGLKQFELLNKSRIKDQLSVFANPRNATAGTLKTLNSEEVRSRKLSVFFYRLFPLDGDGEVFGNHQQELAAIAQLGLPVNPFLGQGSDVEHLKVVLAELESSRPDLDYQIDGAVIKVDDLYWQQILGNTTKAPRWGLAYKFAAEEAITTITNISLQVGRTGVITPVAELDPVFLSGSTISRATLHNWDEMQRKDIRVGDQVVLVKGGEIIPKVLRVLLDNRTGNETAIGQPSLCPVCGKGTVRDPHSVALKCENLKCPAILAGRLRLFTSRDACDIEGLAGRSIDQFLELGLVSGPGDLFRLSGSVLSVLPGWGEKSAERVLQGLQEAISRPWEAKIFALGIPQVGVTTAATLARNYHGIDELLAADKDSLAGKKDIGPVGAQTIIDFFASDAGRELVEDLKSVGFFLNQEIVLESAAPRDSYFSERTFVLTGSMSAMTRTEARKEIEARGGKVTGSVSVRTDVLVVGEKAGSKLVKAEKLGIEIINEEIFLERLKSDSSSDKPGAASS